MEITPDISVLVKLIKIYWSQRQVWTVFNKFVDMVMTMDMVKKN